jgi:peptidoglycan/LPS O-acetylase OafA/YrhL
MEKTIKFERSYELDWLRIIATILIFFFHSARAFNYSDWEIKNAEKDFGLSIFIWYVDFWVIPIFFIIAGMGTFYALGVRKGDEYIKERFNRLMIPLIVGMFTHLAIQVYLTRLNHSQFNGSFIEFYFFHYFNGIYMGPSTPGNFNLFGGHMWYLLFLFIYSLLTLKLFLYLRKEENIAKLSKLGTFFNKPGALFLLAIPIFIIEEISDRTLDLPDQGGYQIPTYIIIFIYGFLLVSHEQFKYSIEKHGIPAFVIAIGLIFLLYFEEWPGLYSLEPLSGLLHTLCGWCWVITVLYLGRKFLNFKHKSLKFLNDIVLPFYVLHQSIIIIVGFYIISLDLTVIVKYIIVASISFAIIIGLLLIIKRVNFLRFLFGMRIIRKEN